MRVETTRLRPRLMGSLVQQLPLKAEATPPSPPPPGTPPGRVPAATGGRLEDFLDGPSGGGALLLGAGPLTLMDELHSQILGSAGLLEHAHSHSPMDTSDLGYSAHHPSPSLGFEDPTLDSMDWLDISMAGGPVVGGARRGGGGPVGVA